MNDRFDFAKLINDKQFKAVVEVGVFRGQFSKYLLENTNINKLIAVDTWARQDGSFSLPIFEYFISVIQPYIDRVEIHKLDSISASKLFKDNDLDFVYIDADHSYEAVSEDLKYWWPKVKIGGVLAGDDYAHGCPAHHPDLRGSQNIGVSGVDYAVNEFVRVNGLKLNLTTKNNINWWINK